jgi:hypothetical protein
MTTIRRALGDRAAAALAVGWLSILLVASGCATPVLAPGASEGPGGSAVPEPADRIHAQAQAALERWATAVRESGGASITFTGELTSQIGDWEDANGDNKTSLLAGLAVAAEPLSQDVPGRREVKWLDGSKIEVNVLSAAQALADLVAAGGGDCPDCPALLVTDASLAMGLVETSRGPAEAPMWVYTIEGTAVRVTRVAVDDSVTVDPPPWNAMDPPVGISIDRATGSADSRKLEVTFVGAPEGRDKPCGADYRGEAVESDLAVVVIVHEDRNPAGACRLVGALRTVKVTLTEVLGDRVVLEVKQGLPVPVLAP